MLAQKRNVPTVRDRWGGPVARRIVDHLCELSAEFRAAKKRGDERAARELERRIRKLESYVIVLLSNPSREADKNRVILNFAQAALPDSGTWSKLKRQVDEYEMGIGTMPKGRPAENRCGVTHALECKLTNTSKTWNQIAESLQWEPENLKREIRRLRSLLRQEKITIPSTSH